MTGNIAIQANLTDMHNGTPPLYRMFWEAGFPVFGLHGVLPDGSCACRNPSCRAVLKHPRVSNWQHTPHWSDEQLKKLEAMGHFNTGYGIVCQIDDEFDLLVVDVDERNGGLEAYDRLLERVPDVDDAGLIVKTGSGGGSRHMYFKVRKGAALATKHPDYNGIDFKSGSGFVVGPGSLHASGNRYKVVYGSPKNIKEAPEELVKLLKKPERHRTDPGNRSGDVSNAYLADMVRHITGFDDYEDWVRVGMALHHASGGTALEVWDQWSSQSVKYRPEEMHRKWRSFGNSTTPVTMGTLIHLAEQCGWRRPVTSLSDVEFEDVSSGVAREGPLPKRTFRLTRIGELSYKEPVYLVDEFVEAECLAMIFGDPGCGKSFLAVDLALSVATCTGFHGRKPLTGPVVYLAGEGHNGLMRRIEAWSKEQQVDVKDSPLFLSQSAAQFLDDVLVREVDNAIEGVKEKFGSPVLIIVDTVARSFGGGDENSTADMNKFVAALDQFRERYACTILLVHHTGHTDKKRARGNMALKGALDAEYRVEKKGDGVVVECTKMKDAPEPPPMHFALMSVELGVGQDGKPITSAVLRPTGDFSRDVVQKMSENQLLGLSSYQAAVKAVGSLDAEGKFAGIHVEQWRDEFYRKHTGDNIDTKRRGFNRARKDLVELRRLKVEHDIYHPDGDLSDFDNTRYAEMIAKRDTGQ